MRAEKAKVVMGPGWEPDYSVSIRHAETIAQRLRGYSFSCSDESELQEAVAVVFKCEGFPFEREVSLSPKDRIDFVVHKVGIEVKTAFSPKAVVEQLIRYAKHEEIDALVLVTTRAQHRVIPGTLLGKVVYVVHIAPAFA